MFVDIFYVCKMRTVIQNHTICTFLKKLFHLLKCVHFMAYGSHNQSIPELKNVYTFIDQKTAQAKWELGRRSVFSIYKQQLKKELLCPIRSACPLIWSMPFNLDQFLRDILSLCSHYIIVPN